MRANPNSRDKLYFLSTIYLVVESLECPLPVRVSSGSPGVAGPACTAVSPQTEPDSNPWPLAPGDYKQGESTALLPRLLNCPVIWGWRGGRGATEARVPLPPALQLQGVLCPRPWPPANLAPHLSLV